MAWFTDLARWALAVYALWELRALRRAVEGHRPSEKSLAQVATETFRETVQEIQDQIAGPTLPQVMNDEAELAIERQRYETAGARAGYQVVPHWLEQDERDALLEDELMPDA